MSEPTTDTTAQIERETRLASDRAFWRRHHAIAYWMDRRDGTQWLIRAIVLAAVAVAAATLLEGDARLFWGLIFGCLAGMAFGVSREYLSALPLHREIAGDELRDAA